MMATSESVTKPMAKSFLDFLEQEGLIVRTTNEAGEWVYSLTEQGEEHLSKLEGVWREGK
ncbi:hypothetical protein [Nitrososphaera sp.]|uniref:hypothetical protein n=1 Tax=Nitrososphaera sp. TaxID=1971748 RepID=UPI002ED7B742